MKAKTMWRSLLCGMLLSTAILSCKKNDLSYREKPAESKTSLAKSAHGTGDPVIAEARSFFDDFLSNQPAIPEKKGTQVPQRPWYYPDWDHAVVKQEIDGQAVEVPLKYPNAIRLSLSGKGRKFNAAKHSTLKLRKGIQEGYKVMVVLTMPDAGLETEPGKNFSGLVIEKSWDGSIIRSAKWKNGREKVLRPDDRDLSLSGKNILECTAVDYYECDDIDEYGVGTNCRYLYTEYIGCTDDDDGGGGGDTGGGAGGETGGGTGDQDPQSDCAKKCATELNSVISGSRTVSETVGFDIERIDSLTDKKNPKWKVFWGFPGSWGLNSQELGEVVLLDPVENRWAWKSLEHGRIYMVGFTLPGVEVSHSTGIGTPSFTAGTPNVYYASMKLDFIVTYVCKVCLWPDRIPLPYTSESPLWNAKP